jgi:hypothetical protein
MRRLLGFALLVIAVVAPAGASASVTTYLRPTATSTSSTPWSITGAASAWQALDDPVTSSETPSATDYISANVSHNEGKQTEVGGFSGLSGLAGASSFTATAWFYTPTSTAVELRVRNSSHAVLSKTFTGAGWHSLAFPVSQSILEAGELSLRFDSGTTSGLRQIYAAFIEASYQPASASVYWGARMDGDVALLEGKEIRKDAPWTAETWNLFENHAAKAVSIVHFGQPAPWEQAFAAEPLEKAASRGAIPLMSMNSGSTSLTEIAKPGGGKEPALRAWLKAVRTYEKPFFLRWNWEMNGKWFPWGEQAAESPSNFVAAWRHFHDLAVEEGATNITWVWCPNAVFEGSTSLSALYPGDEYVDWTCMDGYNTGTNPIEPLPTHPGSGWISFYNRFQPTYQALTSLTKKPIMIAETASSESGGSKSGWIRQALAEDLPQSFPSVKAFVWFNWNILDESGKTTLRWDWPIESSASSQTSFANQIASPFYASNSFGSLPLLKPVQPLP